MKRLNPYWEQEKTPTASQLIQIICNLLNMFYYRYILQSLKDKKVYIGYTNDLKRRLQEHNTKKSLATKCRAPFKLVYYEAYLSKQNAQHRERNLKFWAQAYTALMKRISVLKDSKLIGCGGKVSRLTPRAILGLDK